MYDVALIHPPSVYDFRKLGYPIAAPISDVVPSRPVFDMYPAGFLSLASYLEERGVRVGIFNLAALMLLDERFDVVRFLKSLKAAVYAIDLHWLVHAHGALKIAEIVKRIHDAPVVLGGLSATYYWREILERYPWVDYVILGDTAEPALYGLYQALYGRRPLSDVPNLAYRDRSPKINGIYAPCRLDGYRPKYDVLAKVFARSGVVPALPWADFLKNPIAAVISYKGCRFNCITCGGSSYAYRRLGRICLGVKSPLAVFEEFREVAERLKAPVFFVGDLQILGRRYVEELVGLLHGEKADVELIFEFFTPPAEDLLKVYRRAGDRVLLQISPEDPDEDTRMRFGRPYTNSQLFKFAKSASIFERVDYYFMIGLPGQRPGRPLGRFYIELYRATAGRANAFVAPLAPFVDPGSPAFEMPERFGYRLLAKTLEDHAGLLLQKPWYLMLNYETDLMDRRSVALATYEAAYDLARAKAELGQIDPGFLEELRRARDILEGPIAVKRDLYPPSDGPIRPRLYVELFGYNF
ncbi:MAG: TIGR04190 family B12-binding domain/radical SAM domain protein [Thermoproteus sp.]